jgi:capsular polysaccharide biosynthesis protein
MLIEYLLRTAERAAQNGLQRSAGLLCRLAVARRFDDEKFFHRAVDLLIAAGALTQAEGLCRARLRARSDDPAALVRLAFLLLDSGRAELAAGIFRDIDRFDGVAGAVTGVFVKQHLDLARARAGKRYYRWLDDALVDTAYWTIMKDGVVYNDDVHAKNLATSPFVRGRVSADGSTVIAALPAPAAAIGETCILVGGDDNYSHWLFRNMLKLSTLDHAGLLHSHPWLVNADLRGYQLEYMRLLGNNGEDLIKVERNTVVRCARLLVPALPVSRQAITEAVAWMRERVAHLRVPPAQATRRLFLSRRDNGRRRVLNEDALFDAVAPLGFERVVPGEQSVAAQIAAFSSARIIIAAHGAGLTNMIFMPPGAAIVELTSTAIEHMDLFRMLSRSTGHTIETVCSDDYADAGAIGVNSDYRVDVNAMLRAVDAALARSAARGEDSA